MSKKMSRACQDFFFGELYSAQKRVQSIRAAIDHAATDDQLNEGGIATIFGAFSIPPLSVSRLESLDKELSEIGNEVAAATVSDTQNKLKQDVVELQGRVQKILEAEKKIVALEKRSGDLKERVETFLKHVRSLHQCICWWDLAKENPIIII